jgi:hypothetical protein
MMTSNRSPVSSFERQSRQVFKQAWGDLRESLPTAAIADFAREIGDSAVSTLPKGNIY